MCIVKKLEIKKPHDKCKQHNKIIYRYTAHKQFDDYIENHTFKIHTSMKRTMYVCTCFE